MFKKLFTYLFKKPNIKVGDTLAYYDKICIGIYFNWEDGLWFINLGTYSISWGVEEFYRTEKRKAVKNEINN